MPRTKLKNLCDNFHCFNIRIKCADCPLEYTNAVKVNNFVRKGGMSDDLLITQLRLSLEIQEALT